MSKRKSKDQSDKSENAKDLDEILSEVLEEPFDVETAKGGFKEFLDTVHVPGADEYDVSEDVEDESAEDDG